MPDDRPLQRHLDGCYCLVAPNLSVCLTDATWAELETQFAAATAADVMAALRTLHTRLRLMGDQLDLHGEAFTGRTPRQRPPNAHAKLKAVQREIDYRQRNYPRWVKDGRMKQADADAQIAIFREIEKDYT